MSRVSVTSPVASVASAVASASAAGSASVSVATGAVPCCAGWAHPAMREMPTARAARGPMSRLAKDSLTINVNLQCLVRDVCDKRITWMSYR